MDNWFSPLARLYPEPRPSLPADEDDYQPDDSAYDDYADDFEDDES